MNGSLSGGITDSYDSATGVLFLIGSASGSDYEAAIAQVVYLNTSENPNTTARIITVVGNDGSTDTNMATATINVVAANAPPTLDLDGNNGSGATGNDYSTAFTIGGNAVAIGDSDIAITDDDGDPINSATITLTNRLDGDAIESLSVNGSLPGGSLLMPMTQAQEC